MSEGVLKFERVDLMEGYESNLYVYEVRGDFMYDIEVIRICRSSRSSSKWEIKVRDKFSKFTLVNWSDNFPSLKEAKMKANASLNPKYRFKRDLDEALAAYKMT